MPLVPNPKNCDISVKRAIQGLSKKLGYTSNPTFAGITYSGLTTSRLVSTDANKKLASVANLASWVAGTANEIDITNDGDGTITVGIVNPLIVSKGGTGMASLTDHSLLVGSGTGAITALGVAANGQLPIGSTGVDPTLATITGTSNQVNIANAAGSITLSTPQDIATDSYPLFVNTNSALSSMILTGGGISAGTDAGTIKIAALTAMLRTDTGALDNLTRITLAEQDNITLAAVDIYYNVLLTYGDPCTIATSTDSGNGANIIGIGHCLKETDGIRHYANAGLRLTDGVRKLHYRASKLRKIEKSTGVLVSETGTRNLYMTAGTFHRGVNSYDFTLKDTSASPTPDTFDYYYYNPTTSAWVKDDNSGNHYTQIDIVQYNKVDSGTGLDNLVANKYTTNWVFVHPDDEHILVVYGRSNSTLTAAENENIPPSLPDVIDKMGILLCKIIVRATTGALVFENIEYFAFTPEIAVDHNELQGLQGGTANEYYHLTSAEHTLVSAIGGLTPTDSNFIVGNGSTWIAESGDTVRTSLGLAIGTNVQAHSDALDDLTNAGIVTGDSYFLVGTGAGILAWETTTTARTSIGLGIGNSPQFTGIELGHATDTTITRASAGNLNIEGNLVYRAGGIDIPIADGGTGQSTAQAAIDVLTAVSSATNEHVLTKDTASGNAIWKVAAGSADAFTVKIDAGATAGFIGAANNDGILRTGTSLSYTDGGNFVTINAIQDIRTSASPTFAGLIIADGGTVGQIAGPLFTFDDTNNYLEITGCDVGIGIITPISDLHVSEDGVAPPAALISNVQIAISNQDTTSFAQIVASSTDAFRRGVFKSVRARGTFASPVVPITDDYICSFAGDIYDGVGTELTAAIDFIVDGNVSEDVAPQRISFSTSETTGAGKLERLTVKSDGKIGIGTTTAPHGGVGTALFALEGINASTADGPHIQITTNADDYPLLKIIPYAHDNISFVFDAYTDAGGWKSSDAGSNFMITKNNNTLAMRFESGVAAGSAVSWTTGWNMKADGGMMMFVLKSGTTQGGAGAAANELWVDTDDDNTIKMGV